jgi:uncharacterized protein YcaQ
VHDYFRLKPRLKDQDLEALVEQGRLHRVRVQGWTLPAYVHAQHAKLLKQVMSGKLAPSHTTLLSPFDPLVWDRERASVMFGFDYRIECYTPETQRTYGYFVLPILHRGQLIGRLDAKAHRAQAVFEVKALFLEPGTELDDESVFEVAQAIQRCATWHVTPRVALARTAPAKWRTPLRQALRRAAPLLP